MPKQEQREWRETQRIKRLKSRALGKERFVSLSLIHI